MCTADTLVTGMSYQKYCLVAVALASLVSSREAPTTTAEPPHPHPHHGANHQHHGHHKLEHHSLVKFGDEEFGNDLLSRTRRGIKDKINLLGVIGQLYTEQREDQEQAAQKIGGLLSDSVAPEPSKEATTTSTLTSSSSSGSENMPTEASGSSTTAGPYRATASQLMGVLRRNIVGLRNLLQKEWSKAMEDSKKNSAAAKVEFSESVRPFLKKNGTASG